MLADREEKLTIIETEIRMIFKLAMGIGRFPSDAYERAKLEALTPINAKLRHADDEDLDKAVAWIKGEVSKL